MLRPSLLADAAAAVGLGFGTNESAEYALPGGTLLDLD